MSDSPTPPYLRGFPLIALSLISLCLFVFAPGIRAQGRPSVPTVQAPEEKSSAKKEEVTIQTKAARGEAPLVHLYEFLNFESSRIHHLPALKPEEMQRNSQKRVRIGEVRAFAMPLKSLSDSTAYTIPDGEVHVMGIVSDGALYTRIHFTKMSLPKGARVFVYSAKNPEEFSGPYEGHGASEKGDFWTPPMEGDRVVVEYFSPKSAPAANQEAFQISGVGHIFSDPFYKSAAGSCNLDVTPDWATVAKSVGHLQFVDGSSVLVCTGTLLNDQAQDFTPYLLTANHCIHNQASAQSLVVYWLYNSGNSPPPGTPHTDGATLLTTGTASDFTLLRLTGTLPGGLVFSGWDASLTPLSTPVTGIHHPQGSYKRISFGTTISSCGTGLPGPCQNFTPIHWNSGTTEGGSSGSGIWKGSSSDPRLVGTLTGGAASCSNLNGTDYYGSFNVTYPNISSFLSNGTPPAPPANNNFASAQVITGCTGSATGTNVGANKEAGEPSHSPDGNAGGASVWYQWQAPSTSSVTIDTSGSSYDTLLAVYTGNSVSGLAAIAKNDDATSSILTSSVTFNATAGTTYRIAVDGFGGATGNIVLNWTAANCIVTPQPPTLQLGQNSYTVGEAAGSLTILVNRSGDPSAAIAVNYSTSDAAQFLQNCNVTNGAATSRCDYVGVIGTLHFASGETSKAISIPIVDDTYLEGNEQLSISLSNPAGGAVIGTNQTAPIQITDNDGAGQINPIDDKIFFVRQHYIDFLSREPDPLSAGWVSILNGCGAGDQSCRLSVSQGIYNSPEFRDRGYFIYKFYSAGLGRKPSYDEFNVDRARVSGFQTDAELEQSKVDFIANFMGRGEFAAIYNGLSNNAYVQQLFTTGGVTQITVAGVVRTLGTEQQLLAGGRTRAQVLRDVAESPEVSARFLTESTVVMHYFGYLRRDPDAAYQTWISILTSTGDSRNVTSGFINSAEYRARFGGQ